jgi:hypothetical protein
MATFTSAAATVIKATANGATATGAISISGLAVGDVLVLIEPSGFADGFEQVVSVANELQQTVNLDWSPVDFTLYFLRGV